MTFDEWWATRALSAPEGAMPLLRESFRLECKLAWEESRRYVQREGTRVTPEKPTEAMLASGIQAAYLTRYDEKKQTVCERIYRAMLAAAPICESQQSTGSADRT